MKNTRAASGWMALGSVALVLGLAAFAILTVGIGAAVDGLRTLHACQATPDTCHTGDPTQPLELQVARGEAQLDSRTQWRLIGGIVGCAGLLAVLTGAGMLTAELRRARLDGGEPAVLPLPRIATTSEPSEAAASLRLVVERERKCPSCGSMAPPDAAFCGSCGKSLSPQGPTTCSACGAFLAGARFCVRCGTPAQAGSASAPDSIWSREFSER